MLPAQRGQAQEGQTWEGARGSWQGAAQDRRGESSCPTRQGSQINTQQLSLRAPDLHLLDVKMLSIQEPTP